MHKKYRFSSSRKLTLSRLKQWAVNRKTQQVFIKWWGTGRGGLTGIIVGDCLVEVAEQEGAG